MKKLFRRRSETAESRPSRANGALSGLQRPRDAPLEGTRLTTTQSVPETDTMSLSSMALSEAETLTLTRDQCLHLQDTYEGNFTAYIPYLVRRHRAEMQRSESSENTTNGGPVAAPATQNTEDEADSDDDRTMVSNPEVPPVMHRYTTDYNYKRTMIMASELIRNTTYVFPSAESFELFKYLRANGRKIRKNSVVMYDENCNIRRVSGSEGPEGSIPRFPISPNSPNSQTSQGNSAILGPRSAPQRGPSRVAGSTNTATKQQDSGHKQAPRLGKDSPVARVPKEKFPLCTIDSRPHIVPLDYKVKGEGLPLFKIVVPYMSTFRRKTPYMVFRRYLEKPKPPRETDTDDDEHFETYDFCTVHLKNSSHYKRYSFVFSPDNGAPFKVLAFQNNYRPFTDFNYKDTRFRILGSSITMAYLTHYNPELKLYILDKDQPSLMDNLIDKKTENGKGRKQRPGGHGPTGASVQNVNDLENPAPSPENPIILSNVEGNNSNFYSRCVPHEMPTFGRAIDACTYVKHPPLFPKKYTEIGKIDMYQDPADMRGEGASSTLSVDLDSLVLATVFSALRETSIRTTVKHPGQSHASRMGLLTSMALNGGAAMNSMTPR